MKIAEKTKTFTNEVVSEMKKVSWSTRAELLNSAWIVLVSVAIFTVILWVFDMLFSKAVSLILKQGL